MMNKKNLTDSTLLERIVNIENLLVKVHFSNVSKINLQFMILVYETKCVDMFVDVVQHTFNEFRNILNKQFKNMLHAVF